MIMNRFVVILVVAFGVVVAVNAEEAQVPDAAVPAPAAPESVAKPFIEHGGQRFELASSTTSKEVETDEYVAAGEKISDWTQLVTVQRLKLSRSAAADAFVAYFRKRVEEDTASLDVLTESRNASVFVVRFPKSDRNDEQVMICLAFVDAAKPSLLNVIQYAIKPMRCSVPEATARIRSWRDKFLRQAPGPQLHPTAG